MELNINDARSLTRISRSLWGDPDQSLEMSGESLYTAGLLRMGSPDMIERAAKLLVERAEQNPPRLLALQHPFFRLAPLERFLLTALHVEHWSYGRIARVLGVDPSLIAPLAWATRIKFIFQETQAPLEYPSGPTSLGPNCPEFNPTEPWPQRMLDEELGKKERLFIQNHAIGCPRCMKTLELARRMLFRIEGLIPVAASSREIDESSTRLMEIWKEGESSIRPVKTTFQESLEVFLSDRRAQAALMVLALALFCLRLR